MEGPPDVRGLMEAALSYAARGWRVVPLRHRLKIPMAGLMNLCHATADPGLVKEWWAARPDLNVGIAAGWQSRLWAIDLDRRGEVDGVVAWRSARLACTPIAIAATASGGEHWYFDAPLDFLRGIWLPDGVTVLSDGAWLAAPPSVMRGGAYRWIQAPMST